MISAQGGVCLACIGIVAVQHTLKEFRRGAVAVVIVVRTLREVTSLISKWGLVVELGVEPINHGIVRRSRPWVIAPGGTEQGSKHRVLRRVTGGRHCHPTLL